MSNMRKITPNGTYENVFSQTFENDPEAEFFGDVAVDDDGKIIEGSLELMMLGTDECASAYYVTDKEIGELIKKMQKYLEDKKSKEDPSVKREVVIFDQEFQGDADDGSESSKWWLKGVCEVNDYFKVKDYGRLQIYVKNYAGKLCLNAARDHEIAELIGHLQEYLDRSAKATAQPAVEIVERQTTLAEMAALLISGHATFETGYDGMLSWIKWGNIRYFESDMPRYTSLKVWLREEMERCI